MNLEHHCVLRNEEETGVFIYVMYQVISHRYKDLLYFYEILSLGNYLCRFVRNYFLHTKTIDHVGRGYSCNVNIKYEKRCNLPLNVIHQTVVINHTLTA